MGLFKRLVSGRPSSSSQSSSAQEGSNRKKSIISLVPLSEVTEASLAVWRNLPGKK